MARPTKYTNELADKICDAIASSNRGLSHICEEDGMPGRSTIHRWLTENESFRDKYTRAREDQADFLADELLKIADEELKTTTEYSGGEGSGVTTQDNVQRSRLMIETRKWMAMKLKPKKYGDKLDVEVQNRIITVEVPE